jgi:hypothetical protein
VETAHTNGLWIFGYNRSYGANIPGEVGVADYVMSQGADGYVWDAEAEWESNSPWIGSAGPQKAWRLCSTVRAHWPSKFLAYAPFPIVSYHLSFPYKEFGYWCDAVLPQIYHSGWTGVTASVSGAINWADVNWANWQNSLHGSNDVVDGVRVWWTNAIKPLAPVAEVYGPSWRSPCSGVTSPINDRDVMVFTDYLAADPNCPSSGGYKGVSFWRADLHSAVQWSHIRASTIGAEPGVSKNIVLDDHAAVTDGSWTLVRTFANGLFFGSGCGTDTNSFGTNYLAHTRGSGAGFAEFSPPIQQAGEYEVFEWHPLRTDASARVPFIVQSGAASETVYVNQQRNAGNWTSLGRFHFEPSTNSSIRVTDGIPETNGVALVDALKLVFVSR